MRLCNVQQTDRITNEEIKERMAIDRHSEVHEGEITNICKPDTTVNAFKSSACTTLSHTNESHKSLKNNIG